jgi:RNA polymerase sigma-70 factor (ECF subfamily)
MDIDDTLQRIRAGNRQAFVAVVHRYQRPLFGFLGNMGLSSGQVEDLAQETFLRAWRGIDQYNPGLGMFSTWLFTIARNLALNEIGRAANRLEEHDTESLPDQPCDRPQPQEALELAQRRRSLHAALRRLPVADRCVLALAYLQEMDMTEIARIENSTVGAIKTRLHRARGRLSKLLEKDDA